MSLRTWLAVGLGLLYSGCSTTRYHQRAKLADSAMQTGDARMEFILNKTQAARGGSFGGYGGAAAGGCGCQ